VVTGEKVDLRLEARHVLVFDTGENFIGRIERRWPATERADVGGNRYAAAVAQTNGHQLRVLIREVYQDPASAAGFVPWQLGESALRGGYFASARYDEYGEELMEEDEVLDGARRSRKRRLAAMRKSWASTTLSRIWAKKRI